MTVSLKNTRAIPSISQQAASHNIGLPDILSLTGDGLTVAAGGPLANRDTGEIAAVEHNPQTLRLENGIGSHATARFRWIVRGKGEAKVTFESQKGGTLTKTIRLE